MSDGEAITVNRELGRDDDRDLLRHDLAGAVLREVDEYSGQLARIIEELRSWDERLVLSSRKNPHYQGEG